MQVQNQAHPAASAPTQPAANGSAQPAANASAQPAANAPAQPTAHTSAQTAASGVAQPSTADAADNAEGTETHEAAQLNGNAEQDAAMAEEDDMQLSDIFQPGTVLRFEFEQTDGQNLPPLSFREIRNPFGGLEGGVKHCDYKLVSWQQTVASACFDGSWALEF